MILTGLLWTLLLMLVEFGAQMDARSGPLVRARASFRGDAAAAASHRLVKDTGIKDAHGTNGSLATFQERVR